MTDKLEINREKLIRALLEATKTNEKPSDQKTEEKLKKLYHDYSKTQSKFEPGELISWKPGLRNKKFPQNSTPAIVINHLHEPIIDNKENAGSPYFREPLDLLAGCIDEGGDFVIYHFDSRRFMKHEEH